MSRKSINDGEGGAVIVLWNMGGVKRKHDMPHSIEHSIYETLDTFFFKDKTEIFQNYRLSEQPFSLKMCMRKNEKYVWADGTK